MENNMIYDWLDKYGDKEIEKQVEMKAKRMFAESLLKERSELIKNCSNEDLLDGSFLIKLNELNIAIGQLEDYE